MRSRSGLWVLALFAAVLVAAGWYKPPARLVADTGDGVPEATPPGITLQIRANPDRRAAPQLVYADTLGLTLYVYGEDKPGHSACSGGCAQNWPPAVVPVGAAPHGDWGVISRSDGTRQWTHGGLPLYRFAKDKEVGDVGGDGAGGGAWHVATLQPDAALPVPDAVATRELGDAGGVGLTDALGMTLYVFDGTASQRMPDCLGRDCASEWLPLEAAAIAGPGGDFDVLAREDGITQWRYRGKPLYKFSGDGKPGDVTGAGVDPRFHPSLVLRFFMPRDAAIRRDIALGAILATTRGATLYQRDLVINEERHEFRADHGSPALGRSLGVSSCDAQCTREWTPYGAPSDAVPSGYWDVLTRPDGSRQWAYKGFALYTYRKDAPGELNGHEIHTLGDVVDDSGLGPARQHAGEAVSANPADSYVPAGGAAAGLGISAMFWHAVVP
jgi:predicted lipoprotein with Yx(FWY)xxD motif